MRRRTHTIGPLLVAALAVAWPTGAVAASRDARDWHVAVEGVTDFPLDVGGRLSFELPLRLRVATTFAAVPETYVAAVEALIVAEGGCDDASGGIVSSALSSSFLWRIAAGWRPLREYGFYFEVGYALAILGAGIDGQRLFDAAVTIALPPGAETAYTRRHYEVESMLHLVTAEVGWEWVLGGSWVIRVAGGFVGALGASSDMGYRSRRSGTLQRDDLSHAYEAWLDEVYTAALFTPTVTVALGLRLY